MPSFLGSDPNGRPYPAWAMSDPSTALWHHLASKGCAKPIFREAVERRHFSPQPKYRFDNNAPNRSVQQTRISILSWNPGPRRGREGAIEEHFRQNCTLLRHKRRLSTFNTSASRTISILPTLLDVLSCSTLFTRTSRLIPSTSTVIDIGQQQAVREGQSGWDLQAVISLASVRWISRNGKSYFTMMSHMPRNAESLRICYLEFLM